MTNEEDTLDTAAPCVTHDLGRRAELLAVFLDLGLRTFSERLLTTLTLLLDAGIFSWAMSADSWMRLLGAALFAVASWCVVYLRPPKEKQIE